MHKKELYSCRICGLSHYPFLPWGEDNMTASFVICECCGAEFGYDDCNIISIQNYRKIWLENGGNWLYKDRKPANWSLSEQLENISINIISE